MIQFFKNKIQDLFSDQNFSEILNGSAWALGSRIVTTFFGLISSIIIARVYGPETVGIVALISSFLMIASIITVFGTDTSILRLIPEHLVKYSPTSAFYIYRKTHYVVMLVSIVVGIIFFCTSDQIANIIFRKPSWSFYVALASIFVVFNSMTQLNTQAVRGLKLIRVFALMQIFPQGFNLLFLILLFLLFSTRNAPVYALLGSLALTGIVGWTFMIYGFRRLRQPSDIIISLKFKTIFSTSAPMLMTSTVTFIIGQSGVIFLGIFRSEAEIGYYTIAVRLATLTTFLLSAINSIAAPKFAELYFSEKIDKLFHIAKKSAKLSFWSSFPILFGLIIFGKPILNIAFGKEFGIAYLPMALLVIGQFVNSISGSTGYFMNMTDNEKILRNIILISAIINIGLNFLLIPTRGALGASIAACISISLWNIATLIYMKLKFGKTTGYIPSFFSKR